MRVDESDEPANRLILIHNRRTIAKNARVSRYVPATIFNGDLSNWDTSRVEDIHGEHVQSHLIL